MQTAWDGSMNLNKIVQQKEVVVKEKEERKIQFTTMCRARIMIFFLLLVVMPHHCKSSRNWIELMIFNI